MPSTPVQETENDLFPAITQRWDGGYSWEDTNDGRRLLYAVGADRKMSAAAYNRRWKSVSVQAGAVEEFASLDATEQSIANFASKYGDLLYATRSAHESHRGKRVFGSTFSDWSREVDDFRFWFTVWSKVHSRRSASLRDLVAPSREGWWCIHPQGAFLLQDGSGSVQRSVGGRVGIARLALAAAINERLSKFRTNARLAIGDNEGYTLSFRSDGLMALLWLHFARRISGSFRVRRCENAKCHKFLTQQRSTKRFCSDTCRTNAKSAATSLARDNRTESDIKRLCKCGGGGGL